MMTSRAEYRDRYRSPRHQHSSGYRRHPSPPPAPREERRHRRWDSGPSYGPSSSRSDDRSRDRPEMDRHRRHRAPDEAEASTSSRRERPATLSSAVGAVSTAAGRRSRSRSPRGRQEARRPSADTPPRVSGRRDGLESRSKRSSVSVHEVFERSALKIQSVAVGVVGRKPEVVSEVAVKTQTVAVAEKANKVEKVEKEPQGAPLHSDGAPKKRRAESPTPPPPAPATIEAPSSTTTTAVSRSAGSPPAAKRGRYDDLGFPGLAFTDSTDLSLTRRFGNYEASRGERCNALERVSSSDLALEDISVVIERNLPPPAEPLNIRLKFESESDVLSVPRDVTEGHQSVFDRPEIRAFRHDAVLDDEGYVETRKVVRRGGDSDAGERPEPRIQRRLGSIGDYAKLIGQRCGDESKDGSRRRVNRVSPGLDLWSREEHMEVDSERRNRGRTIFSRVGDFRRTDDELETWKGRRTRRVEQDDDRMEDRRLPDFSQRPNKGYLEPAYRDPLETPKHAHFFLHDDRDDGYEMELVRGGFGNRRFSGRPRRGGFFSGSYRLEYRRRYNTPSPPRDTYDRVSSYRRPYRGWRSSRWSFGGRASGRGRRTRADVDTWQHDMFEDYDDDKIMVVGEHEPNSTSVK